MKVDRAYLVSLWLEAFFYGLSFVSISRGMDLTHSSRHKFHTRLCLFVCSHLQESEKRDQQISRHYGHITVPSIDYRHCLWVEGM
jgi:hypothetical protein